MTGNGDARNGLDEGRAGGKITRRRVLERAIATSAVGLAATLPGVPWRAAFGQTKAYRIGTLQPLSGGAAAKNR